MLHHFLTGYAIAKGFKAGSSGPPPSYDKESGKRDVIRWFYYISWFFFFCVAFSFNQIPAPRHIWNYILITGGPILIGLVGSYSFMWIVFWFAVMMTAAASISASISLRSSSLIDWSSGWHRLVLLSYALVYYVWSYELAYSVIGTRCVPLVNSPCINGGVGAQIFALLGTIGYIFRSRFMMLTEEYGEIQFIGHKVRTLFGSGSYYIATPPVPYIVWALVTRSDRGRMPLGFDLYIKPGGPEDEQFIRHRRG